MANKKRKQQKQLGQRRDRISGIIVKPHGAITAGKTLVIGMVALPFIKFGKYKINKIQYNNKSQRRGGE